MVTMLKNTRTLSRSFAVFTLALAASLAACPDPSATTEDAGGHVHDDDDAGVVVEPEPPVPQDAADPEGVAPGDTDALSLALVEAVGVGRFVTSTGCALCHSNHDAATAMRDARDNEIGPFNLWRATMMANSSRDPYWRALLSVETALRPTIAAEIEAECIKCHAPMASVTASDEGTVADLTWLKGQYSSGAEQLAVDGVSCTVCHQTKPDNFGTEENFSGNYILNDERRIYGPHLNPATGPMQNHVQYTPTFGDHVLRAELCASCHVLETQPMTAGGSPLGNVKFLEQSTYLEWLSSDYGLDGVDGKTCQACHMPNADDAGNVIETRIARSPPGGDFLINPREPFGRHLFVGANSVIPTILKNERDTLNPQAPDAAFDAVVVLAKKRLQNEAAELMIDDVTFEGGRVRFDVTVQNRAGHKLPTGFPSRRAFLQARVLDAAGNVLFASGTFDEEGRLTSDGAVLDVEKAGAAFEPHHTTITRAHEVQIYEQVMIDETGAPTFSLLSAVEKGKDNRILPSGFDTSAANMARIGPRGLDDGDFVGGHDLTHYDVRVSGTPATVEVTLYYQGLSARSMRELFQHDTPEVRAFRTMLERVDNRPIDMVKATATF
jgi:hypothetical protein